MKLSEFIGLSDDQKRASVLTDGVAVAKRSLPDRMAFLFQFPGYYVETFFTDRTLNLMSITSFKIPGTWDRISIVYLSIIY